MHGYAHWLATHEGPHVKQIKLQLAYVQGQLRTLTEDEPAPNGRYPKAAPTTWHDVEDWVVNDSPFDVSRQDVDDFRDEASDGARDALQSQGGAVVSPGEFYGSATDDHVRVAVVQPDDRIELVAQRLGV